MFFTTLITILLKFLAAGPLVRIVNEIFLALDRGVYQLVQTSFSLFMLMSQLNLDIIYKVASGLVDRLKALIIVFIIFKVGVALIQYMLDTEKAAKGSKRLLLNILVCAAMLVSCNFVFKVFNDISMMIIGKPEIYSYNILSKFGVSNEADEGLLMRLFFATDAESKNKIKMVNADSVGNSIAFNTLCALFPDSSSNNSSLECSNLEATLIVDEVDTMYNFKRLSNVNAQLDKTIDGHPGVALILGLYIIYSVIKAAIEIGVRLFKIMVLQIIAPIAIISVASDEGTKAKPFVSYTKMYISVYISAFTRISAVLLVTAFVSKVFTQIKPITESLKVPGYTTWIVLICMVAGYRFAGEFPKMIDRIFETKLGENPDKGFGKFLTTLAAAPVLGTAGIIGGAVGAQNWYSGVYGGLAGGLGGLSSAFKGNTIADKMKLYQESQKSINKTQAGMNASDSLWGYLGGRIEGTAGQDRRVKNYDNEIADYEEVEKLIDDYGKGRAAAIKDDVVKAEDIAEYKDANGNIAFDIDTISSQKFGDDKKDFIARTRDSYGKYAEAKATYEKSKAYGVDAEALASDEQYMIQMRNEADKKLSEIWETKRNNGPESADLESMRKQIASQSRRLGHEVTINKDNVKGTSDTAKETLEASVSELRAKKRDYMNRGAYRANHPRGGK